MNYRIEICGDWAVRVEDDRQNAVVLAVSPAPVSVVTDEDCGELPLFNPKAAGWMKGYRLRGVTTQETTARGMLVRDSLSLYAGTRLLKDGVDYGLDGEWGTIGRLEGGTFLAGETVRASYSHLKARLDSIVLGPDGSLSMRTGEPHPATPPLPPLKAAERRLANIWIAGPLIKLTSANLYIVHETEYPVTARPDTPPAKVLTPRTWGKLTAGGKLRILAWGDSVTEGTYLNDRSIEGWQAQFVSRLRGKFPGAEIELLTEAWGGRNTNSYFAEPPGALHNYAEKVLAVKPDLIVSEFVNDGGFRKAHVEENYGRILRDFRAIGAEWIIITPHYILPEWMGGAMHEESLDDPREYVRCIREFAVANNIAVADASRRYGRLRRQGLPYMTLMMNAINHPNPEGMKIFADSLMELF